MIAATAVKHKRGNRFPPDKSITDWVNFKPKPDTNTEPIIRIYSEAMTEDEANKLVNQIKNDIKELS